VAAIGLKEILVIGVVVLLLFGTSILPRLARNGGKRLRETKTVLEQSRIELEAGLRDAEAVSATRQPVSAPRSAPVR
jgi:TatA/E family protein of Tat protein translocase